MDWAVGTGAEVLDNDVAPGDDLLLFDAEVSLRLEARGEGVKVDLPGMPRKC